MRACFTLFAVLLTTSFVAGCPKSAGGPDPAGEAPPAAPSDAEGSTQVCCESFGYGAMMAKCCESYAWTTPEACTVPDGMVGGGKAIVSDDKCVPAAAP